MCDVTVDRHGDVTTLLKERRLVLPFGAERADHVGLLEHASRLCLVRSVEAALPAAAEAPDSEGAGT